MSDLGGLRLEVVADRGALRGLRDGWDEAVAVDATPNPYLTWDWVDTWWGHFGDGGRLHVVVVRDDDGIVAVAPLQRVRRGVGPLSTPVLERVSPEAGDYGGVVLARREAEAVELLAAHLEELVRGREVAAVVLSRLGSDDPFLDLLRQALVRRTGQLAASEAVLDGTCLFTDLRDGFNLAKHTKKHKIRQRLRRLGEAHDEVTFAEHTGEDLQRGLDRLLAVHAARWEGREEEVQGLLAEPDREAFMLDAIRALDRRGGVKLLTLAADGRTVAAELDFQHRDRIFMFKGAFDPEFSPFSPGQLLHHRVFEDALATGVEVVDFGRGDQLYKRRWANGERHQVTLTLTTTGLPGKLATQRLRATRRLERGLHPAATPPSSPADDDGGD